MGQAKGKGGGIVNDQVAVPDDLQEEAVAGKTVRRPRFTLTASPSAPPALAFQINLSDFDPRVHHHAPDSGAVKWVTFHSAYDFGYLLKLLIGQKLPKTMPDILKLLHVFFDDVYNVKHMMMPYGDLYGGLERVAATLKVERAVGRCHQVASDSLLTWDVFWRMRELYFVKESIKSYRGVLFGLEPNLHRDNKTPSSLKR
ncbi:hypothetical protein GUJ93_ZPchr0005g14498 [Zizania palustris]|uniref:Uncharacterized protein n=1 Tax=Zizania palustris TaxID=103762 RepID=A0A8J5SMW6_ZIZPA|nr:hypothetical protein GUJ93_ZPchr0005g14498 [Zizania palustris]